MNEINFNIEDIENINFDLGVAVKEIAPSLENLNVIPTREQQIFNHEDSYGYDKVTVEGYTPIVNKKTITENGIYNASDDNLDGYSSVEVATSGGGDISVEDGLITRTLTEYSNDRVTEVGGFAFYNFKSLKSVDLPNADKINGNYTFYNCISLESADLPNVTSIGDYAFQNCNSLLSIDLPNTVDISKTCFRGCTSLSSVCSPKVINIGDEAFYGCTSLSSIDLPNATSIGSSGFYGCTSLVSINSTMITSIGTSCFYNNSKLLSIDLPNITSIPDNTFYNCISLESVNLPNVSSIGGSSFRLCASLKSLDLPKVTKINGTYNFRDSNSLITLILRSETICTLSNTNAFFNGPIAKKTGYIYVPSALIDSYKTATNWSTYSTQFRAIEDYPEICGETTT